MSVYVEQNSSYRNYDTNKSWVILSSIESSIKEKIEKKGTPLKEWNVTIYRGILTGYNKAFIIDSAKKDELIAADPKSAEIIRPILRGRDIKRYRCNFAGSWLISTFPSKKYDIDDYPAIKSHLLSFGKERLEQTGKKYMINGKEIKSRKKTNNKWFETQDSISYWDDFSKQKIVWGEISDKPKFAFDINGEYTPEATAFLMVGSSLPFLYSFLNSNLSEYYFAQNGTTTGVGTVRWKKFKIEQIPVPKIDNEKAIEFSNIVNELLYLGELSNEFKEKVSQLNTMIYQLFCFDNKEIAYIESFCNNNKEY